MPINPDGEFHWVSCSCPEVFRKKIKRKRK